MKYPLSALIDFDYEINYRPRVVKSILKDLFVLFYNTLGTFQEFFWRRL